MVAPGAALPARAAAIQTQVHASAALQDYALNLWQATADPARYGIQLPEVEMDELMLAGASPRGMSLLMRAARVAAWLDGRGHVRPGDLRDVFLECTAHRLCLQPVHELRRAEVVGPLMQALLAQVAAP